MNPNVPANSVTAVLLADGWHDVKTATFTIGSDLAAPLALPRPGRRGRAAAKRPAPAAFTFLTTDGDRISGPLTSVLAVKSPAPAPAPAPEVPQWCGLCNDGTPTDIVGQRWTQGDRGIMRCPRCHPHAGATAEPATSPWCGRCQHTAARWIVRRTERNGATAFQPIPCPHCHPSPERLLETVPAARQPYEQYVALVASDHPDSSERAV
ncbi:hypothetical protein ACIQI7_21825 [Kitasatospora sp. NPDC092039]|uniref:hypothetical protein n=1 Tax=Kitasatospora sp. NPDC092039 TaxID=3364086 RepID=UPI00380DB1B1